MNPAPRAPSTEHRDAVIWHDVECGAFEADLALWAELAEASPGAMLELGCGSGRVALHLARHGHRVTAIDNDPALVEALSDRAAQEGLEVAARTADATGFKLEESFPLIVAPMQLIQLLDGAGARASCLRACASHMAPGGRLALAIVDGVATGVPHPPLLPDVREHDGWVYSSLPLGARHEDAALLVERLRQIVDPEGHLSESHDTVRLQTLSAGRLEEEARSAGLRPSGRRLIEPTSSHVGSTIVLLEG
jgi:SAM-dependent methyltransferase